MAGFFHEYPYENFHELNLDWILKKINEFESKVKTLDEIIETLQQYLDEIPDMKDEIAALQLATADLDTIRSDIASLKQASTDTNIRIDKLVDKVNQLQTDWDTISALFDNVYKYIDTKFKNIETIADYEINQLLIRINTVNAGLQQQIDYIIGRLDDAAVDVYNPIKNKRESFDANNIDVYRDLAGNYCPTANDYAKLGLTADEYAAYELLAYDYFHNGFKLLHCDYVFAPLFGFKQEISVAMDSIVGLIMGTMNATEYASLGLSADDYTALGLTAAQYIFYNTNGTGIDASEYASINKLGSGLLMATI